MSAASDRDSEFEGKQEVHFILPEADGRHLAPWSARRSFFVATVVLSAMAILVTAACAITWNASSQKALVHHVQESVQMKQQQQQHFVFAGPLAKLLGSKTTPPPLTTTIASCDLVETGVNYPGNDLYPVDDVNGTDACCQTCTREPLCVAWSFAGGTCFLKGTRPRKFLAKVYDQRYSSGIPNQAQLGNRVVVIKRHGDSLYCFSLMQPQTLERKLLAVQYSQSQGIFACDEYAVYSSASILVAPGVRTSVLHHRGGLRVPIAGEFQSPLNTDVFLTVWKRVASDGNFLYHDWTVKADPDTVFFPARLRPIVRRHMMSARRPTGVYLNNCNHGLHGPLEILSTAAVKAFTLGRNACVARLRHNCHGPCQWGEDMFIDQCLHAILHVARVNDYSQLQEAHCNPPAGWASCKNPRVAAFHPFKQPGNYLRCLQNAQPMRRWFHKLT